MEFSKMFIYFTLLSIVLTNFILSSEEQRNNDKKHKNVKSDEDSDDSFNELFDDSFDNYKELTSNSSENSNFHMHKVPNSMHSFDSNMDHCKFPNSDESTKTDTSNDSSEENDEDVSSVLLDELTTEVPLFLNLYDYISPNYDLDHSFLRVFVNGIKKKALTYVLFTLNDLLNKRRESSMKLLDKITTTIKGCSHMFEKLCKRSYRQLDRRLRNPTYRDVDKVVKNVANKLKDENITLNERTKESILQRLLHLMKSVSENYQRIYFICIYLFFVTAQVENFFLKQLHSPLKLPAFSELHNICQELHESLKIIVLRLEKNPDFSNYILKSDELEKLKNMLDVLIQSLENEIRKDAIELKKHLNSQIKSESIILFELMRYFFTRLINDCKKNNIHPFSNVSNHNVTSTLLKILIMFQMEEDILLDACERALDNYKMQYESYIIQEGTLAGFLSGSLPSVLFHQASIVFQRLFINYTYFQNLQMLNTLLKNGVYISDEVLPGTSKQTIPVYKVFIKPRQKMEFKQIIKKLEKFIFHVFQDLKIQNSCNSALAASVGLKKSVEHFVVYAKYTLDSLMKLKRELLQEEEVPIPFKRRKVDDKNEDRRESKDKSINIFCSDSGEKKEQKTNTMEILTEKKKGEKGRKQRKKKKKKEKREKRIEEAEKEEKKEEKKEEEMEKKEEENEEEKKEEEKEEEKKKKILLRGKESTYPSSSKTENETITRIKELTIQSAIALYLLQLSLEKNLNKCNKIQELVNKPR